MGPFIVQRVGQWCRWELTEVKPMNINLDENVGVHPMFI